MASEQKITDELMEYYRFKARQLFLKQKEDHEWQKYCEENQIQECSVCLTEKQEMAKKSKDVGIQVVHPRQPNFQAKSIVRSYINKPGPVSSNIDYIRTRLDKIELSLSEIEKQKHTEAARVGETEVKAAVPSFTSAWDLTDVTKRRMIIQSNLKSSITRLQSLYPWGIKTISNANVKWKNTGFFLPHDLKSQRIISRKAYLASLPKTSNISKTSEFAAVNTNPKLPASRGKKGAKGKPRQKALTISENMRKQDLKPSENVTETKDELENVVDAILDDLLGETALALTLVEQRKRTRSDMKLNFISSIIQNIEDEEMKIRQKWNTMKSGLNQISRSRLISSAIKDTRKDKSYSGTVMENLVEKSQLNEHSEKTSPKVQFKNQNDLILNSKIQNVELKQYELRSDIMTSPDILAVEHLISNKPIDIDLYISDSSVKQIKKHRKHYKKYRERISSSEKRNFDPKVTDTIAEALLGDCFEDVAHELSELPSSLIDDLYEQEFLKSA